MKFRVNSENILSDVQLAASIIPNNHVVLSTEYLFLELQGNALNIKSTDLEVAVSADVVVDGMGDGTVCVQGKIFAETLKANRGDALTFEVKDNRMEITGKRGSYKIATIDPSDFPEPTDTAAAHSIDFDGDIFKEVAKNTVYATSKDDMRQAMKGVLIDITPTSVNFVATDAFRLVMHHFMRDGESSYKILVPANAMRLIAASVKGDDKVRIISDESYLKANIRNIDIHVRLLDNLFPNYHGVIPLHNPNELTVSRLQFINALKRVLILGKKDTNQVTFTVTSDELTLTAQDLDYGHKATEVIPCEFSDTNGTEFASNGQYLIEGLSTLKGEEVSFQIGQPSRAYIAKEYNSNYDSTLLFMPIMVKS